MLRRAMAGLLLAGIASGCGPSYSDLEKKNPAIEAKLKLIQALGAKIQSLEAAPEGLEPADPPPVFPPAMGRENAVAVEFMDLGDLSVWTHGVHVVVEDVVRDVACWSRKGTNAAGLKPASDLLDMFLDKINRFLASRYVLVLRANKVIEPEMSGTSFRGGYLQGEGWFFDLETQKLIGTLRFDARNDSSVDVQKEYGDVHLLGNLTQNARRKIHEEFKKRYPSGTAPFALDVR